MKINLILTHRHPKVSQKLLKMFFELKEADSFYFLLAAESIQAKWCGKKHSADPEFSCM